MIGMHYEVEGMIKRRQNRAEVFLLNMDIEKMYYSFRHQYELNNEKANTMIEVAMMNTFIFKQIDETIDAKRDYERG